MIPHLQQYHSIGKDKIVGLLLLLPFYFLEFLTNFIEEQLIVNLVLVLALSLFFCNEKDLAIILLLGRKYSIFWWLMVVFF
jgi:hypothetical protein